MELVFELEKCPHIAPACAMINSGQKPWPPQLSCGSAEADLSEPTRQTRNERCMPGRVGDKQIHPLPAAVRLPGKTHDYRHKGRRHDDITPTAAALTGLQSATAPPLWVNAPPTFQSLSPPRPPSVNFRRNQRVSTASAAADLLSNHVTSLWPLSLSNGASHLVSCSGGQDQDWGRSKAPARFRCNHLHAFTVRVGVIVTGRDGAE